jgi:hypothetical protein
MRIESSVTSLSWIPSEAVTGLNKVIFGSGFTHYDDPPPDHIGDLEALRAADRFRFANVLSAWIEVNDAGEIAATGYSGGIAMGSTTIAVGPRHATFSAVSFPDIQQPVTVTASAARFVQTVGGHTALPAPRHVKRPPFLAFEAPTVWTTLALEVRTDGTSSFELIGASTFPRHWIYDADGLLAAKAGMADFKDWWQSSFGKHTPWGDEDSPALVTAVETALERELAGNIMRSGEKPKFRTVAAGQALTEQGAPGDEVYLLLNGVVAVEVDGERIAEIGPGAILGERAGLERGSRTSTMWALTNVKVAVVRPDQLDRTALETISTQHHREQTDSTSLGI